MLFIAMSEGKGDLRIIHEENGLTDQGPKFFTEQINERCQYGHDCNPCERLFLLIIKLERDNDSFKTVYRGKNVFTELACVKNDQGQEVKNSFNRDYKGNVTFKTELG